MRAASTAQVVFFFYCCAFVWLLVASAAGLTASIKLHSPDWLVSQTWLSFGRIRTIHLNAVAYGWAPMAGLGTALFIPPFAQTELVGARYALLGAALWNAALVSGLGSLAYRGERRHGVAGIPGRSTCSLLRRGAGRRAADPHPAAAQGRAPVSVWYMGCALFWFPILFFVAHFPGFTTASRRRP